VQGLDPQRNYQPRDHQDLAPNEPEYNDAARRLSTMSRDITLAEQEGFEPQRRILETGALPVELPPDGW
jgi:hypothetical protein